MHVEAARPEGMSDEDYLQLQLKMMEGSQNASKYVAYKAAGEQAEIKFNGVYVMNVVENMPADQIIQIGDQIKKVDNKQIQEATDLTDYVGNKEAGDVIELEIVRDDATVTETVEVKEFADDETRVGIGIQLITEDR